jgi:hypothetical protein
MSLTKVLHRLVHLLALPSATPTPVAFVWTAVSPVGAMNVISRRLCHEVCSELCLLETILFVESQMQTI